MTSALSGYAVGFVVVFVWTRLLHRRHGLAGARRRDALPAALMGGALGGLCVLVVATALVA